MGTWPGRSCLGDLNPSFRQLRNSLTKSGCKGSIACSFPPFDKLFSHETFFSLSTEYELTPCAYINLSNSYWVNEYNLCTEIGYRVFKIHFPTSLIPYSDQRVLQLCSRIADRSQVAIFCTYPFASNGSYNHSLLQDISSISILLPSLKIILAHGGCTEILKASLLARSNNNVLLDVSHTLMKYASSSVDLDLSYLFRHFDLRCCVGTDWPEFDHSAVSNRLSIFLSELPEYKQENILFRNIQSFIAS